MDNMRMANGFGSIICLDKSGKKRRKPWAVRVTAGWKDGKQVRKYIGYYKTKKEALIALSDYHKNGVNLDMNNITLNELYETWIERIAAKELTPSVLRTHNMAKSRFGVLGNKYVKDIKNAQLQDWLDNLDVKPSTKRKLRSSILQIFEYAFKNDIIVKNHAQGLEINEKIEATGAIFTDEEIATLWKNKNNVNAQQTLILIYTGLRIGELLKIKVSDINFEEQYIIGGSKTDAGKDRVIPIHNKILPFIIEQLGDGDSLTGGIAYNTIRRHLTEYWESLGMEHKIHDTRKTGVSVMHRANIPMETIRIIVGHSGKGVTEQVYLYKTPQELVEAINTIEIL